MEDQSIEASAFTAGIHPFFEQDWSPVITAFTFRALSLYLAVAGTNDDLLVQ
jgi:hypothetical protein